MNIFKKIKAMFVVPKKSTEDHVEAFRENHRHFMKTGEVDLEQLAKAVQGLRKGGYSLQQVLDLKNETEAEPEPKKYSKEEGSNVVTLN